MSNSNNPVVDLSFEFSLQIIDFSELLEKKKKFVVARQLLKSGTSIGANINEAQNGESRADFVHKLKIAAKEANETNYWLRLCESAPSYPVPEGMLEKLLSIQKLLSKIISSTKKSM